MARGLAPDDADRARFVHLVRHRVEVVRGCLDRTGVRSLIALLLFMLLVAAPLVVLVWVSTL
jgi:hypothetical protein